MTVQLPRAGQPKVEWLEPDLSRWTFASDDREVQDREFNHWCGWFRFEEDTKPESVDGSVWIVRRSVMN